MKFTKAAQKAHWFLQSLEKIKHTKKQIPPNFLHKNSYCQEELVLLFIPLTFLQSSD